MQKIILPFGETHLAADGEEAIEAFRLAMDENEPYDLICLDIMMPKIDGHQVLAEIRKIEEENHVLFSETEILNQQRPSIQLIDNFHILHPIISCGHRINIIYTSNDGTGQSRLCF